jgi:hypothetical protein
MTAAINADYTRNILTGQETIARFVQGGRATITVVNTKTDKRYTFSVSCKREKQPERGVAGKRISPYFVKLMTGSDNEVDYTYIGNMEPGHSFNSSNKRVAGRVASKVASGKVAWDWFWSVLNGRNNSTGSVRTSTLADYPVEVWHEGACSCCGKKLSVPLSIALGVGPDCAGTYYGTTQAKMAEDAGITVAG